MVNLYLMSYERKKYLASYVTVTIIEISVNKLQKCLKPFTIIFAAIPSQVTSIF